MQHTPLQTPPAFCGWGEGRINDNIKRILNSKNHILENHSLYEYELILNQGAFSNFCSSNALNEINIALRWLSSLCNTSPHRILLVESQMVRHAGRSVPYLRFHHTATKKDTESFRFARDTLQIKCPWNTTAPHIFYSDTVARIIKQSRVKEQEAKLKVDNLIACLFNSYDYIFDLADRRVYKRKICIELDAKLSRMRHLDCTIIFDQSHVRRALIDYINEFSIKTTANPHIDKIEYFDASNKKYSKLDRNTVILNDVIHPPYAAEHNHLLVRMKFSKSLINFIVYLPALVDKYINKQDVDLTTIIPFHGVQNNAARLEEYFAFNTKNRVIESPISHLGQPLSAIDLIAS